MIIALSPNRTTLPKTRQNISKPIQYNQKNNNPNINFGMALWDYFTTSSLPRKKAEVLVNRYSSAASAGAGALANTGIGDKVALTYITKEMCKDVFKTYNRAGGSVAALTGIAAGTVVGTHLAATAFTIIPGAGNAINATLAYSLHQLTGRALIEFCENNKNVTFSKEEDDIAKFINYLKGGLSFIENDKVRGFIAKGIDAARDIIL